MSSVSPFIELSKLRVVWEPLELADDTRSEDSLGDPALRLCSLANSSANKNPGISKLVFSESDFHDVIFFSYYLLA